MEGFDRLIVAQRIKKCRSEINLTQELLAERLNMKRTNIANYEAGRVVPPGDIVFQMSILFNVSTDYLLGRDSEQSKDILREENLKLKETIKQVQEVIANDVFAVLSHSLD